MNIANLDLGSILLLLIIGTIVGAALSKILSKGPSTEELQKKLNETQNKFDDYRDEVTDHFEQTSKLVNRMTESYRDVYEHLSKGAQSLAVDAKLSLDKDQENLIEFKSLSGEKKIISEEEIEAGEISDSTNEISEPQKEADTDSSPEETEGALNESQDSGETEVPTLEVPTVSDIDQSENQK